MGNQLYDFTEGALAKTGVKAMQLLSKVEQLCRAAQAGEEPDALNKIRSLVTTGAAEGVSEIKALCVITPAFVPNGEFAPVFLGYQVAQLAMHAGEGGRLSVEFRWSPKTDPVPLGDFDYLTSTGKGLYDQISALLGQAIGEPPIQPF